MRNSKRIDKTLNRLRKAWGKNPDLRLSQVILTVFGERECYYCDDEVLLKEIEQKTPCKKEKEENDIRISIGIYLRETGYSVYQVQRIIDVVMRYLQRKKEISR
jgi:uncharacterized protein YihD (DUF1040 family)